MAQMRRTRTALAAAVLSAWASAGAAQGLEIAPLTLDVDADDGSFRALAAVDDSGAPQSEGIGAGADLIAASLTATGLPQPSIILGVIAPGQEAAFGIETLLPNTVEAVAFDLDDLAAREALRESDPELFRQLIEEGHIDPDASDLNRTLQIELARMNCYRSGIDGAWGPGSRRSVSEYFAQVEDASWPEQAPTMELFRAIVLNGDVDCPTPQPVRAAVPRTTTTTTTAPAATQTTTPAPEPAQPSRPTLNTLSGGSGVFR